MYCYNWKHLQRNYSRQLTYHASLQFLVIVCTIAIDKFSMRYFNSKFFMHNFNSRQLLYVLLQLKMFLQNYCNRQLSIHYYDYWLLYALLQLTNIVCTIVIVIVIVTFYALLQLTTVVCYITTVEFSMLQKQHQNHQCNWL